MLILGVDPSQSCGWAYYNTEADLSAIDAGAIKAKGDFYEAKAAMLGRSLALDLIKRRKPDFVAIEMPIRSQPAKQKRRMKFIGEEQVEEASGSGLNAVISSNQMVGAVAGVVGAYGIPFEVIAPVTWRKAFLGFGARPGWQRKDWKKAVRDRCNQLRIVVTNDDMADAVGIAFAGAGCQSFRMLRARAA